MSRAVVIAAVCSFVLAALPMAVSASSSYDWSLTCKGSSYGFGGAAWVWTADGTELGEGGVHCSGNHKEAVSDMARPEGADGLTVTVYAYFTDGVVIVGDQKEVSKSFRVDGAFNLKASVSFAENGVLGYGDLGRYSVTFSVAG